MTQTNPQSVPPAASPGAAASQADLTGRKGMTRNVLASWAGHFVFVITGFIMPRLIDREIGQAALGVWDLGWSLVSYFGLVSSGVMSSVSRYVARFRAAGDAASLNMTISTGLTLYSIASGIVLALVLGTTWLLPSLYGEQLGTQTADAQYVLLMLGLSLVVQFLFGVYNGVITGCHRWGAHNVISAGAHVVTAAGMIVAILVGGGLRSMAVVVLVAEVFAGIVRQRAAAWFVPSMRISLSSVTRHHGLELLRFGVKTLLDSVARIILYQTNNLLVMGYLGPAAVAVYARPLALVRHAANLLNKFAYVLTPAASALQVSDSGESDAAGRRELQDLLLKGTRYALYVSLPMVVTLALAGSSVLRLWMGEEYDDGVLIAVLALGHLASLSQRAGYQVLVGMERHGLPGVATLIAAGCSVPLAVAALGPLDWGLRGAALAVVGPLTIVNGVVIPVYAARVLGIALTRYVTQVTPGPVAACLPLAVCLVIARWIWGASSPQVLAFGLVCGTFFTAVIYWMHVIPSGLRKSIGRRFGALRGRGVAAQAGSAA